MTCCRQWSAVLRLVPFFVILLFGMSEASKQYTIRKGDTLAKIAKSQHVSVEELKQANRVAVKNLKVGTKITIPGQDAPAEKHAAKTKEPRGKKLAKAEKASRQSERTTTAKKEPVVASYHVVRKGDTVASVAAKYSLTQDELKSLNNLRKSRLKKGQKLLVKRIGPKTYIVKRGDTLKKIAKRFDMEPGEIKELNELESSDLKPGQKLYLEEKVDSSIAENFHQVVPNIDEEIKKVSESEGFSDKRLTEKLTVFSKKMLNIPYKFGGNSILGIDCSAYVKKVYGLLGVNLPRTAREQFKEGETINKDELSIGDLVFFRTYASFPSHVGIYLGNNLFIHASSRGKKVTIDSLETPYYVKRFIGGKRLLSEREPQESDTDPAVGAETQTTYLN